MKHLPGEQISRDRFVVKDTTFLGRIEDARLQYQSKPRKVSWIIFLKQTHSVTTNTKKIERSIALKAIFKKIQEAVIKYQANYLLNKIMSY